MSVKQIKSNTLTTQNYNPIETLQPLSNTNTTQHNTVKVFIPKSKSHLLLLLTLELHHVTDAIAHIVSGAGKIFWSYCKYGVICYLPKFWISKYWWILGNFLEINHLIWYGFCWFGMDFAVFFGIFMGFDWIQVLGLKPKDPSLAKSWPLSSLILCLNWMGKMGGESGIACWMTLDVGLSWG